MDFEILVLKFFETSNWPFSKVRKNCAMWFYWPKVTASSFIYIFGNLMWISLFWSFTPFKLHVFRSERLQSYKCEDFPTERAYSECIQNFENLVRGFSILVFFICHTVSNNIILSLFVQQKDYLIIYQSCDNSIIADIDFRRPRISNLPLQQA